MNSKFSFGRLFMNLMFLFPVILLSIFVWNDYTDKIDNLYKNSEAEAFYYFDEGRKVVVLANEPDRIRMRLHMFDGETGQRLQETTIMANVHEVLAVSYQKDQLIIVTYDEGRDLQLNVIHPSGEVSELAMSTLPVPSYLTSGVMTWQDRILIAGETSGEELLMAEVHEGKLAKIMLNQVEQLPARPVRVSKVNETFDQDAAIPVFEADLIDDRTAYISGILNQDGLPAVGLEDDKASYFDERDRIIGELAQQLGRDNKRLVRVENSYPKQAQYYNASTDKWGAVVPTPQPVYQAKVYALNEEEALIVGSSAKDPLQGKVIGYVLQRATGEFADVSPLVGQLSYNELNASTLQFFKATGSGPLYYVNDEKTLGLMHMGQTTAQQLTYEQALQLLYAGKDTISLQSFWSYVLEGGALVINWVVWIAISVFTVGLLVLVPILAQLKQARAVARGVMRQGTIVSMKETGLEVNHQPMVAFRISFEDEGQMKEIEIKKVISYLNEVRVGDSVLISYDRKRNRAVFATEGDIPAESERQNIDNAILERIDKYGEVGRGQALLLHFRANDRQYAVPVVQPVGFEYRAGERATLAVIGGLIRMISYGQVTRLEGSDMVTMQGEIIRLERYPMTIQNRQLMVMEVSMSAGDTAHGATIQRNGLGGSGQLRRTNSMFVPKELSLQEGAVIPVSMRREDYTRELRLLNGKQGAARVIDVQYEGTLSERPLAHISVERGGSVYKIYQSIEPVYGVVPGDELWVAYDEYSREAMILQYST